MQRIIPFEDLSRSNLIVDAIYKGGCRGNLSDDVLSNLFEVCENSGGFRKVKRRDGSGKWAYVILYTSMEELEWPDYLDVETGIFRYYGDNRAPGRSLLDTPKHGNKLLEEVFNEMHCSSNLQDIPPFFIFKKHSGRDIKFLGLAVPGNPHIPPDRDLVSFWRSKGDERFQNYEAYFTILDEGEIRKEWIHDLIYNHSNDRYAPQKWKKYIKEGKEGIVALSAKSVIEMPTKYQQMQTNEDGRLCLSMIREFCNGKRSQIFEQCAVDIVSKMDAHFKSFEITRPWRDGGRDAVGFYEIHQEGSFNSPLRINCALEAKCYSENNSVGVREMSRLISRIRYRQFGILVTTSYVDNQAYSEVVEDGHPILIVTASDIATILRKNSISPANMNLWLLEMNRKYDRDVLNIIQ